MLFSNFDRSVLYIKHAYVKPRFNDSIFRMLLITKKNFSLEDPFDDTPYPRMHCNRNKRS